MRRELKSELRQILQTVILEPPLAFTFGGRRIEVDSPTPYQMTYTPAIQNPLIAALHTQLYQHCYCRRFAGTVGDPRPPSDGGKDLTNELAQANAGQERWEPGWQVVQIMSSGQIAVQRNGLSRLLWPGEYLAPDGPGGMPRRGNYVSVFCRKHSTSLQPGFYFAFGESIPDQQDESSPVRFYWNIQDSGIVELMRSLTRELNRFQVPFRFKCLTQAAFYDRADVAVLYVAKRHYRLVAQLLASAYQSAAPHLQPDAPLFAKPLAPGLGLAEDPANGESFGSHRCRLVAEAIWSADTQGRRTPEERLQEVERHFRQHGLTLESPYLSRGSIDCYEWPVAEISLQ